MGINSTNSMAGNGLSMLVRFSHCWWGSHASEVLMLARFSAGEVLTLLVRFSYRCSHSAGEVLMLVRFSCGLGSLLVRFSHCWQGYHAGEVLTLLVTFSHCRWGSHTDGEVLTLLVASGLRQEQLCTISLEALKKKRPLLLSGPLIFNIILITSHSCTSPDNKVLNDEAKRIDFQ